MRLWWRRPGPRTVTRIFDLKRYSPAMVHRDFPLNLVRETRLLAMTEQKQSTIGWPVIVRVQDIYREETTRPDDIVRVRVTLTPPA